MPCNAESAVSRSSRAAAVFTAGARGGLAMRGPYSRRHEAERTQVTAARAVVFITTGLWPLVRSKSFEAVTGPKLEGWLVKTVGF
jgi:hypothetical protein